jgi:hypothetical protein
MKKLTLFTITVFLLGCGLAQPVIDRVQSNETINKALANLSDEATPTQTRIPPTPRPTFTVTPTPTDTPTSTSTPTDTPTLTPTPTETLTPEPTATPTETFTPAPTEEPMPTDTPVPPTRAPQPQQQLPPTDTPTPEPPTPTPTPDWAFKVKEQGDRTWQKTNYHAITNIVLITDASDTPLGGYRVVGEHSSGKTYKSEASTWQYDKTNGLEGYIKQGNLKVEPGLFEDGVWEIYLIDSGGTQVSDRVSWSYSSDPETWVWDFLWWSQ